MRRNFKTAPQTIRELAYFALVRSQVEYAASAWSPWLLQDTTKLKGLQHRGAMHVSRNYQQTASVRWESLKRRRKKLRVQMLHKMLNNIVILAPTTVTRMESSYYDLQDFNNQRIYPLYC